MPIKRRGRGVVDFPKIGKAPSGGGRSLGNDDLFHSFPWECQLPESRIPIDAEISINSIMREKFNNSMLIELLSISLIRKMILDVIL